MQLNPYCMCCLINKQEKIIRNFEDEEKKVNYMKGILRRLAEADPEESSPSIYQEFQEYFSTFWNVPQEDYTDIKKEYNSLMMELEGRLRKVICASPDPLASALQHARIGNYIDFAALSQVDKSQVLSMIEEKNKSPLDPVEYSQFLSEMASAKNLVYLTDNCGEIVLDKIALSIIKEHYPDLNITAVVRGEPVVNDATLEDAVMCGLTEIVPVMGNGSGVCGTWLKDVNEETLTLLNNADVIISKGQGNFETLNGCGLNIYYLFLCKCDWFVRMFQAEPLQGMFVNERRVNVHR
ncbi:MAG: ARMT1-like domain-containing protein [Eubacteriales bacterium]|nr:ARMT1-like domain-containing protein [Eubacteriales bacterium]